MLCRLVAYTIVALGVTLAAAHAALPAAPTNLRASATSPSQVSLFWNDNSSDETSFVVSFHQGTSGALNPLPIAIASNATSLDLTGTAPSTTYQFQIAASNSSGVVTSPAPVTVTMPALPNGPTNLTAVAQGPTTIKLNWRDTSNNETNLLVAYRDVLAGPGFSIFPGGSLPANTTNFIATNPPGQIFLQPAKVYEFFIRNIVTTNSFSDSLTVRVTNQNFLAATNLTATALTTNSVKLQWSDTTSNEANFSVVYWQQNVSSSDQFSQPIYSPFPGGVLASNTTNFTVTGLVPGDFYRFVVQSVADNSNVVSSASAFITLPGPTSRKFHPATVGAAISTYNVTASVTGGAPTLITASNLPPGLTFNAGLNQVSGTPTQAGIFNALLTAHYTNWGNVSRFLTFRVIPQPGAPIGLAPIPKQIVATNGTQVILPLAGFFSDPDTEKAVRYVTTQGNFDVALYATATPQTVSNFLNYVNRGDFDNSIVHRSSPGFVVQGGGYKAVNSVFVKTPSDPGVTNEPGIRQAPGTIAMAKLGGQPNSATSEWFFNIPDNSSILDDQSGGFTAFGRILGTGMTVINTIDALPDATYTVTQSIGTNVFQNSFDNVPIDESPAPSTIDYSKLVYVQSVTPIAPLAYSITSNSTPSLINATINGSNLVVSSTNRFGGASVLTLTVTDLEGNTLSTNLTIEVNTPYTTWLNQFALTGTNTLATANPDGDRFPNGVEFALIGSPTNAEGASVLSQPSLVTVSNELYLALSFNMSKTLNGALVAIAATNDVSGGNWSNVWTSNDASTNQVVQKLDQTNFWKMTVRDNVAITTNAPTRFLQLKVTLP